MLGKSLFRLQQTDSTVHKDGIVRNGVSSVEVNGLLHVLPSFSVLHVLAKNRGISFPLHLIATALPCPTQRRQASEKMRLSISASHHAINQICCPTFNSSMTQR